jgi:hypothetical protein
MKKMIKTLKQRLGLLNGQTRLGSGAGYDWDSATRLAVAQVVESQAWKDFIHDRVKPHKSSFVPQDEHPVACGLGCRIHQETG